LDSHEAYWGVSKFQLDAADKYVRPVVKSSLLGGGVHLRASESRSGKLKEELAKVVASR
jgi:hypothetical protein